MRTRSTITTPNGINWYYEQEGSGPHVVLVPDGFGECKMFDKPLPIIAAAGFTVTTFDMPGMSRSANAPPETYTEITAQKLASYIISIMDALNIEKASIWGCSSGALTVLALATDYPERVRNGMPHEAPTYEMDHLMMLLDMTDDEIAKTLKERMPSGYCGNLEAWWQLGEEAHARLWKNYPRWARGYPGTIPRTAPVALESLKKVKPPLDWTVGASTPNFLFFDNIVTATKAGIPISTLPGMHFPYVSDVDTFAKHVIDTSKKYL